MSTFLAYIRAWLSGNTCIHTNIRHGSLIISSFIIFVVSSFIAGYLCGIRKNADTLQTSITRDAFADQIYNSLCVACSYQTETENSAESDFDETADNDADQNTDQNNSADQNQESRDLQETTQEPTKIHTQYHAQLAGYTSLKRAEAFAKRTTLKKIPVLIKERKSTTAKGKHVTWYQVVTEPYEDQDALNSIVAILKKEEKLHDVKIMQG